VEEPVEVTPPDGFRNRRTALFANEPHDALVHVEHLALGRDEGPIQRGASSRSVPER